MTPRRRRFTLAGRLALLTGITVVLSVAVTLVVAKLAMLGTITSAALALLIALPIALIATHNFSSRITRAWPRCSTASMDFETRTSVCVSP